MPSACQLCDATSKQQGSLRFYPCFFAFVFHTLPALRSATTAPPLGQQRTRFIAALRSGLSVACNMCGPCGRCRPYPRHVFCGFASKKTRRGPSGTGSFASSVGSRPQSRQRYPRAGPRSDFQRWMTTYGRFSFEPLSDIKKNSGLLRFVV
jgi:hypothetical protein